jgi:PTS system mannose-specific IIA component
VSTPVGIAVVGHGATASELLAAARGIVDDGSLDDVLAIDAGLGETPLLGPKLCDAITAADHGRGVLVLVDLLGASPCQCAQRQATGHELVVLSGLNLAMLLKLARIDRVRLDAAGVAEACADSGRRAVEVRHTTVNQELGGNGKVGA